MSISINYAAIMNNEVKSRLNSIFWRFIKRIFDFLISLAALILFLSWFIPLMAILIKLSSKGPIFFRQERWGKNSVPFTILKFRSMYFNSAEFDKSGRYLQARKDDVRITGIGKILRKTNIDELPQLLNVLKGDMSLIGPRPHPVPLNLLCIDKIPHYNLRHLVKPGLTGWAQVNGFRGDTKGLLLMNERIEHDIWYIKNWSLLLDFKIFFLSLFLLIKGDKNAY